jgi:fatty acid synthase
MIGPLVRWDHSVEWPVMSLRDIGAAHGGLAVSVSYGVDVQYEEADKFYIDHMVDGRVLFPFTGHIVLAWRALAKMLGQDIDQTPIVLEVGTGAVPCIRDRGD